MKTKWPREQAALLAQAIVDDLRPSCERIVVAGSIRRRCSKVSDIEILYIPRYAERRKPDDLLEMETYSLPDDIIDGWVKQGRLAKRLSNTGIATWGKQNKMGTWTSPAIPVDFFATTEPKWWVSLVIRTGSKRTNLRLTTGAQKIGRHLHAYGEGVSENGRTYPCLSERDVFDLCGVPYLEPEMR